MDSVDVNIDVSVIGYRIQALEGSNRERRLRVATWNFSGLCSERNTKGDRGSVGKGCCCGSGVLGDG